MRNKLLILFQEQFRETEDMFIILPFVFNSSGIANFVVKNTPLKFISIIQSKSRVGIWAMSP